MKRNFIGRFVNEDDYGGDAVNDNSVFDCYADHRGFLCVLGYDIDITGDSSLSEDKRQGVCHTVYDIFGCWEFFYDEPGSYIAAIAYFK